MNPTISQRRKTPEQILAIKEVQRATELAMGAVVSYLRTEAQPTSEEAHRIINKVLAKYDCESPEGHIVAGGRQTSEPHEKGNGVLARGVPIVIDIYPRSKTTGYFSDMSRTVCIGKPNPDLQKMYDTVVATQELAISLIRPKAKCGEIHEAAEKVFKDAGYVTSGVGKEFKFAEGFVHSVGHGVGVKLHEHPRIGRRSSDVLEEGDVITIEPGLYYKDKGGIRVEDIILVTEDGFENLTNFPKQFSIG